MTAQRKYIERKRQMVSKQGNGTLLVANKQHTLLVVLSDRPSKTKIKHRNIRAVSITLFTITIHHSSKDRGTHFFKAPHQALSGKI